MITVGFIAINRRCHYCISGSTPFDSIAHITTHEHSSLYITCLVILININIIASMLWGLTLWFRHQTLVSHLPDNWLFSYLQFTVTQITRFCCIRCFDNILTPICILRPQWVKSWLLCCIFCAIYLLYFWVAHRGCYLADVEDFTRLKRAICHRKKEAFQTGTVKNHISMFRSFWCFVNITTCRI